MKNKNFSHYLIALLSFSIILWSGCLKEHDEIVPEIEGIPAGGMTSFRIANVEDNIAEVEMTFFVVDHFGGFISKLKPNDFSFAGLAANTQGSITELLEEDDEEKGPYSATLLFDQSGSINSTDPHDSRIDAGTSFAKIVKGGDEAAVAAFASGGFFQSPFEVLQDFTNQPSQLAAAIGQLAGKASGGTPLYRSIHTLIPYTSGNAKNTNRAIVAFTDGQDTDGGVTINQLVQLAQECEHKVRIYTVGLGKSLDFDALTDIAVETGGAVMLAKDAIQLVALYNSLGDLLHGEAKLYKMAMQFKLASGSWKANDILSGTLSLKLSETLTIDYPFKKRLSQQDVGEWYERLPACPCTYQKAQELAAQSCPDFLGVWKDCGAASQTYHYGATSEVRWWPKEEMRAGQQCTYDANGKLITAGIAAGSPDRRSPRSCGTGFEFIDNAGVFLGCALSDHCVLDVKPWVEGPCWYYLEKWPANNADACSTNRVTDIQHIRTLIGDMTCHEVTYLFKAVDENLAENHNLRRLLHRQITTYPTPQIISDLTALSDDMYCWLSSYVYDTNRCAAVKKALENLQ